MNSIYVDKWIYFLYNFLLLFYSYFSALSKNGQKIKPTIIHPLVFLLIKYLFILFKYFVISEINTNKKEQKSTHQHI